MRQWTDPDASVDNRTGKGHSHDLKVDETATRSTGPDGGRERDVTNHWAGRKSERVPPRQRHRGDAMEGGRPRRGGIDAGDPGLDGHRGWHQALEMTNAVIDREREACHVAGAPAAVERWARRGLRP